MSGDLDEESFNKAAWILYKIMPMNEIIYYDICDSAFKIYPKMDIVYTKHLNPETVI